jgi:DNA-nicking Smr family endonuclease
MGFLECDCMIPQAERAFESRATRGRANRFLDSHFFLWKPSSTHYPARMAPPTDQDDDAALFREAIGPVTKLPDSVPPPSKPRPKPAARMAERDEADARSEFQRGLDDSSALAAADTVSYKRESLPAHAYQRLKRGRYSAQDELDLHGATSAQAESMLREFLAEAHAHGFGCVRIIHGKGQRGGGEWPVLKNLVDRMLRQRADILAFHSAPAAQGGTGALLVLLARR